MAELVAFREALIRCGCFQAAGANAIIQSGFNSLDTFTILNHSGLDTMINRIRKEQSREYERSLNNQAGDALPQRPPPLINDLAQVRLHGMLTWAKDRKSLGIVPLAGQYTGRLIDDNAMRYSAGKTESPKDLVKPPGKLTSTTSFVNFRDRLILFLESKTGQNNGAPLSTVLRDNVEPPGADYQFASDIERQILCTPLSGRGYLLDNTAVFNILRECTLNEPAESHVLAHLRSRDGRAAYLAIKDAAEGGANGDLLVDRALKTIESRRYRGELASFGIQDLNSQLTKAFQTVKDNSDNGTGMEEREKVRRYKQCFMENPHPSVRAAIATIDSNPNYKASFAEASSFMEQQMIQVDWPNTRKARNVSSVTVLSDGSQPPELKHYPPEEYKKFTSAQKDYLRKNRKSKEKSKDWKKEAQKLKRRVKALKTSGKDQEEKKRAADDDDDEDETPSAGKQFMQEAKKKKG